MVELFSLYFKRLNWFSDSSELFMISFTIGVLFILFIPIPAGLLDVLLIANLSWALLILLLTFSTDKPLSFSTFPSLLLIATLFRLALNVSATRLILMHGNAGHVIETMGKYVIHGNYIMGLAVFFILIIVQYIVVTGGAQRVAEVAARFTLDSMPGKQMSIDADLNMGLISQPEAKNRRSQIEKEANFYGAMDGASKFVKGDAIAGILIILVDSIGGFIIGVLQQDLSFTEALQTYTLLTVGDGLVTQIPALIISIATGIIVTRAATDNQLGHEVAKQIQAYPQSLFIVCIGLLSLFFLQSMPFLPVMVIFALFAVFTGFAIKTTTTPCEEEDINLYDKIRVHPIEIHVNTIFYAAFTEDKLFFLKQIDLIRETIAQELGFVIPEVKLRLDLKQGMSDYAIFLHGNLQSSYSLHLDKQLAIASTRNIAKRPALEGITCQEPCFHLDAVWIEPDKQSIAKEAGYTLCDPKMVLFAHLKEILTNHLADLLTRSEIEQLLDSNTLRPLRDDLIPGLLSFSQVQRVLQSLLQEKVPIRQLPFILETLLEHAKTTQDPASLTEFVRQGLGRTICQPFLDGKQCLAILTFEPRFEQKLSQHIVKDQWALDPALTEELINALVRQVERMLLAKRKPVLLCSALLRRPLRQLTQRLIPLLTVLSLNEIPLSIQVESFGIIE